MRDYETFAANIRTRFPYLSERKATLKELWEVRRAYEENFVKLQETVGTDEHDRYVREEQYLDMRCRHLRDDLGILLKDPCPVKGAKLCEECTGFVLAQRKEYNDSVRWLEVAQGTREALECPVKKLAAAI